MEPRLIVQLHTFYFFIDSASVIYLTKQYIQITYTARPDYNRPRVLQDSLQEVCWRDKKITYLIMHVYIHR